MKTRRLPRIRQTAGRICGLVLSATILAGCVAPRSVVGFIGDRQRPYEGFGLRFLPPQEGEWLASTSRSKKDWEFAFMKQPDNFDAQTKVLHTVFLRVSAKKVEASAIAGKFSSRREAMEQMTKSHIPAKYNRLRILEDKAAWEEFKGADCLHRQIKAEEQKNPADPQAILLIETENRYCFHPLHPEIAVWLQFSQRYHRGAEPFDLKSTTDRFLRDFQFISVD